MRIKKSLHNYLPFVLEVIDFLGWISINLFITKIKSN